MKVPYIAERAPAMCTLSDMTHGRQMEDEA